MTRISRWIVAIAAAVLLAPAIGAQQGQAPAVLLESARQKAVLEGDLRGAIRLYQDVFARFSKTDRPTAAQALFGIAECYEKLGDPQAAKYFEQVVSQYADQSGVASSAKAKLATGLPRAICEDCGDPFASISPDGRLMATVTLFLGSSGDHAGDIGLYDLGNNRLTPLGIEGSGKGATGAAVAPVFSPDGRQLAYSWQSSDAGFALRIVARNTPGKSRTLPNANEYAIMLPLGWGAPGILAIAQKTSQALELVMVSPTDGAQRVVKSLGFNLSPGPHVASLSPDGRYIAYERFVDDAPAFVNGPAGARLDRQIRVVASDGSGDVAITTGAGIKRWAKWTPTGSHVLYISNVGGAWDLWATPVRDGKASGEPILVRKNLGDEVQAVGVSASGHYHFYEGRSGIFKTMIAPVAAGAPASAAGRESFVGERPSWSPDGSRIAVSRPRQDGAGVDVVVRTLATGDERVYKRDGVLTFPFIWVPGGDALLVQVRDAPDMQFWYRLDVASGEFARLARQRGNPAFWTHQNIRTVSADGRTLYFGTYANQEDATLDRITAMDLATGSYRDIFRLPGAKGNLPRNAQEFAVAASPDGRSLAVLFGDPKAGVARLAVVGVDGQGYREIVPAFSASNLRNKLAWSRDGRWIFFTTKAGDGSGDVHRIMRVAASGGRAESATSDIDGLDAFAVNGDGTRVAFSTLRPEGWAMLLWSLDASWLTRPAR